MNKEIDNTSKNIVNLSYKDHILAHFYLCYSAINNDVFLKLVNPLKSMVKETSWKPLYYKSNREIKKLLKILQKQLNKQQKLIKKRQLDFYNEVNLYFTKNKKIKDYAQDHNKKRATVVVHYTKICRMFNLPNLNPLRTWSKDDNIKFYNSVSKFMQTHTSFREYDKINNYRVGYTCTRYGQICNKYKLKNYCRRYSTKEMEIDFYNEVNEYLKAKKSTRQFDRDHKTRLGFTEYKYRTIIKRYNLPNMNTRLLNEQREIKLYKEISNYLKKGWSLSKFDRDNNNYAGYSSSIYTKICKKYNFKNYLPKK